MRIQITPKFYFKENETEKKYICELFIFFNTATTKYNFIIYFLESENKNKTNCIFIYIFFLSSLFLSAKKNNSS